MGRPAKRVAPPVPVALRSRRIVVVDDNPYVRADCRNQLETAGFASIQTVAGMHDAWKLVMETRPDVALIDIHLGEYDRDGLDLMMAIRVQGFAGCAVAISFDQAIKQIYRALVAGADDYWVKGPCLNTAYEMVNLLTRPPPVGEAKWEPGNLARIGFWRTVGATDGEILSIVEYARSFGQYEDVADDLHRSPVQFRKTMSNVKQKCQARSLAEFGQLLTICELMGCRPPRRRDNEPPREIGF